VKSRIRRCRWRSEKITEYGREGRLIAGENIEKRSAGNASRLQSIGGKDFFLPGGISKDNHRSRPEIQTIFQDLNEVIVINSG
jgi:hypothetical protein